MNYVEKLIKSAEMTGNITCMGIDPDNRYLPLSMSGDKMSFMFHIFDEMLKRNVIPAAFKINQGFFEVENSKNYGERQLKRLIAYIREEFPSIPLIFDFKRADIGNSSENYAQVALDWKPDAVTVNPFMGTDSVMPFIEKLIPEGIGVYILNRTSNKGAKDFQDLTVLKDPTQFLSDVKYSLERNFPRANHVNAEAITELIKGTLDVHLSKVYEEVTAKIREWSGSNPGGVGAVVGATSPDELDGIVAMYAVENRVPILIPGIGAQGGDAAKTFAVLSKNDYDLRIARGNNARELIHPWRKIVDAANGDRSKIPENWPEVCVDQLVLMNKTMALPASYLPVVEQPDVRTHE